MIMIQKSTRTHFLVFLGLHNLLRMKFGWYYKWHLFRCANLVHMGILAIYLLAISFYLAMPLMVHAEIHSCYWVGDSDDATWSDASHWSSSSGGAGSTCNGGANIPGAETNVIFNNGSVYTSNIDTNFSVNNVTVSADYIGTITQAANLTTTSNVSLSGGTWNVGTYDLDTGSGHLTIGAVVNIGNSAANGIQTTNLTINSSGSLIASGDAKINLSGSWTNSGTFAASTSTVLFDIDINNGVKKLFTNGAADSKSFYNLSKQGTGELMLAGSLKTNGLFSLSNGTFISSPQEITANSFSQTGGTFYAGTSSISLNTFSLSSGDYHADTSILTINGSGTPFSFSGGTFDAGQGSITYAGTSASAITSMTGTNAYYNLNIGKLDDNHQVTFTAAGDITVNNILRVTSGGTNTHTFNGSSHIIILSSSARDSLVVDSSGAELDSSTSTIRFTKSARVPNLTYHNLQLQPDEAISRAGSIAMGGDESDLECAVMDPNGEYAYFGSNRDNPWAAASIIKIRLSDFSRVGSIVLNAEEAHLTAAAIDRAGDYAYFGVANTPSKIIKIRLSDFTRVDSITLNAGENYITTASIDPANEYIYFGTGTQPARVIKIRLSDFSYVGAITLNAGDMSSGENFLRDSAIDPAGQYAYFGGGYTNTILIKINLSTFTRVGALTLSAPDGNCYSTTIDPAGNFIYIGTDQTRVIKINLATFTRVGAVATSSGEIYLHAAFTDPAGNFAYFGTCASSPAKIVKINLTTFTRVGVITLNSGENETDSGIIDPAGNFAYFGTDTSPGKVVKINLTTFTRVGAITLNAEDGLCSAVIDPTGDYAYFGTHTSPGRIVKIRLSDFTRVDTLTLNEGENSLHSAVIDPTGDYAYFGTYTSPGRIVKIRLSDFTRVGAITLDTGENSLESAVIDPTGDYAYFGTHTSPGRIVKIRLSDFTRVDTLTLNEGENSLHSAVIDPTGDYAYFGTYTYPAGIIVKIRLSDFTRVAAITLNAEEYYLYSAVIDPTGDYAYFGTGNYPGIIVKIRLSDFTRVDTITLDAGENSLFSAVIDPAGDYVYFGTNQSLGKILKISTGKQYLGNDTNQTIRVNGNLTIGNGSTYTIVSAQRYNSNLEINGDFINSNNATFIASDTASLLVTSNFRNDSGSTFTHSLGTVTLNGQGPQAIATGGDAFYNLNITNASSSGVTFSDNLDVDNLFKCITPSAKLTFTADTTSTLNDIELNGQTANTRITIGSTSTTAANWSVTSGTQTDISYVSVSYNNASGGAEIDASNNTNLNNGNNQNWKFNPVIISGAVYTNNERTQNIGADKTIALSVNGGAKTTTETTSGGFFEFSHTNIATNNLISIFLDDESAKASLISQVINNNYNIANLSLFTGNVVLTHQTTTPLTNTLLDIADNCNDSDILYSISSATKTFISPYTARVEAANSYTPGGNITTAALYIGGSFSPEANTLTLTGSGTPLTVSGTFLEGTSTTIYTGTTATNIAGTTYYNLILDQANTAFTANGDITASNVLTVNAGVFNASDKNIILTASGTPLLINDTFNPNTSTVKYLASANVDIAASSYYHLVTAPAGPGSPTYTLSSGTVHIIGNYTNGDGINPVTTVAASPNTNLDIDGDFINSASVIFSASNSTAIGGNFSNAGTFNHNNGTVTLNGSTTQTVTSSGSSFYNLTLDVSSLSSVIFSDSATILGIFANSSAGSRMIFHAGSRYDMANIDINGTDGSNISMKSSITGSNWLLNVGQASPSVSYVEVQDSDASVGSIIDDTNHGIDFGNNYNWIFPYMKMASIVIAPDNVALTRGAEQQFVAKVYALDDSEMTGQTIIWKVVNGGGTINDSGVFIAGETVGNYTNTIQASVDSISGYASVNINTGSTAQKDADTPKGLISKIIRKVASVVLAVADKVWTTVKNVIYASSQNTLVKISVLAVAGVTTANSFIVLPFAQITLKDFFLLLTNYFLSLFAIKKRDKYGAVYDSETIKSVSGALVILTDVEKNRNIALAISDNKGRFIFPVRSGKYTLSVVKPGYSFPANSSNLNKKISDVYNGGIITVTRTPHAINRNILIDIDTYTKSRRPIPKILFIDPNILRFVSLIFGSIIAITALITQQSAFNYVTAGLFAVLWLFQLYLYDRGLRFSTVMSKNDKKPIDLAVVRVVDNQGKCIQTYLSDQRGKVLPNIEKRGQKIVIQKDGFITKEYAIRSEGLVEHKKFYLERNPSSEE